MEEIIRESLVIDAEAQEMLKERKKEIELGYEQKNALDYLKKYSKLTEKKAKKLMEELSKITKLRERQVISIVNLLPEDNDDLRLILEKDYNLLTDEEKTLILESVKKIM